MFNNRKFLIIGGTSKAGTTSLYTYLADHPQICPSALKETRFFLDSDYPLPVSQGFNENLDGYEAFFSECVTAENKVMLEATPDYLYSNTARRIAELLPNAKIVFILRDPIERLVSWFKFARQRGMLDNNVSFEHYVRLQLVRPVMQETPVYLRALDQGLYLRYLAAFEAIMPDRLLILSYNHLKSDPAGFMKVICDFAGLDQDVFNDYAFRVVNESKEVKFQTVERLYVSIRRQIAYHVIHHKKLLAFLKYCNKPFKLLLNHNHHIHDKVEISDALMSELQSFYAKELLFLKTIFN